MHLRHARHGRLCQVSTSAQIFFTSLRYNSCVVPGPWPASLLSVAKGTIAPPTTTTVDSGGTSRGSTTDKEPDLGEADCFSGILFRVPIKAYDTSVKHGQPLDAEGPSLHLHLVCIDGKCFAGMLAMRIAGNKADGGYYK